MLDASTELGEHGVGHIGGQLGAKEHPHALGTNQLHRLLHLRQERLGRVGEQQVRFVEEEHQFGLIDIADFGKVGEQIGEHPHQERREHHRPSSLFTDFEKGDDAAALIIDAQQVSGFDLRFAEEGVTAGGLKIDQRAQDHPCGLCRHAADRLQLLFALVAGEVGDYRAEVFQIQKGKALLVGPVEDQAKRGLLSLVEPEHFRQQDRPKGSDRCPYRNPDATGAQRKKLHREGRSHPFVAGVFGPLGGFLVCFPGSRQPGKVALEVRHHHRHTGGGELLGDHLQGLGLTGSGGAGNQAVAVHHRQRDADLRRGVHLAVHNDRAQFQGGTGGGVAGGDLLSGGSGWFGHSERDYCAGRNERG